MKTLFSSRCQSRFKCDKDNVFLDIFLSRQRIHQQQNLAGHVTSSQYFSDDYNLGTKRAFSRLFNSKSRIFPSTSSFNTPSFTSRTIPTKFLWPCNATRNFSLADSPAKRIKSEAFFSGRSSPGEETSSRSYSIFSTANSL